MRRGGERVRKREAQVSGTRRILWKDADGLSTRVHPTGGGGGRTGERPSFSHRDSLYPVGELLKGKRTKCLLYLFKVKNTYEQIHKGKYFKEKNILRKKYYFHCIIKFFVTPSTCIYCIKSLCKVYLVFCTCRKTNVFKELVYFPFR